MIHLEGFNIFKKKREIEKLYQFIPVYDAAIYRNTHKQDVLSTDEISKIKNSVKNTFSVTKTKFVVGSDGSISFNLRDIGYLIRKFNDEWYILTKHDMDNNVGNYLCDQLEGLLQCIKNEIM